MRFPSLTLALTAGLIVGIANHAQATAITLTNGDFETGDLTGWTTFLTANGTIGVPAVVPFDVNGDTVSSNAAQFNVGQVVFVSSSQQGGGIFQSFVSAAGLVSFSADIASSELDSVGNASGGIFSLLVDGVSVATHDFGSTGGFATERATLGAVVNLSGGSHEIRFLMTRPFITDANTPRQYIDDVQIDQLDAAPVPEPATLSLLGLGLLGAAVVRFRRRR